MATKLSRAPKRSAVKRYFAQNSGEWIRDAYEGDGYTFPTALARVQRTIGILMAEFPHLEGILVDLGCGGGQLCLQLAEKGFRVTGIDESAAMLAEARQARASLPSVARSRVRFLRGHVLRNALRSHAYDAVTALGLIGYLRQDEDLFKEAGRLLRARGLFIVSCRNRLFNMVSFSHRTLREIERGDAKALVEEIGRLFQRVPPEDATRFVSRLRGATSLLRAQKASPVHEEGPAPSETSGDSMEARQQTPEQMSRLARAHGFEPEGFHGIHPHLLIPNANRLLPPGVFNRLSRSLETLAHLPVGLVWSSVFLGVFRKTR